MKITYDPAVREQVRLRKSLSNRESVAEFSRTTRIAGPCLYIQEGQPGQASGKAPKQWSAADKLAAGY